MGPGNTQTSGEQLIDQVPIKKNIYLISGANLYLVLCHTFTNHYVKRTSISPKLKTV